MQTARQVIEEMINKGELAFSVKVKCHPCGKTHSVHVLEFAKGHDVFQCECGYNYMRIEY